MKSKLKIGLGTLGCAWLALTNAHAIPIPAADLLGTVNPGAPASPANEIAYINGLLGLAPGQTGTAPGGNTLDRSLNTFASTPTATLVGDDDPNGNPALSFLDPGYTYLVAKYAGGNGGGGGDLVWDIASIAAGSTITIPGNAFGTGNDQYQLSGWVMYNATGSQNVPDGGSTAMLLGIGLFGCLLAYPLLAQPKRAKAKTGS